MVCSWYKLSPKDFSVYTSSLVLFHSRLASLGMYVLHIQLLQAQEISSPNDLQSFFSPQDLVLNINRCYIRCELTDSQGSKVPLAVV